MDNNEMPKEEVQATEVLEPSTAPQEPVSPQSTVQPQAPINNYNQTADNSIPPEYKPISMWGYFGYEILFAIPCIGFILLCVFAFGGTSNINLKNFARSYFCMFIVTIAFLLIFLAIFGVSLGAFAGAGGFDPSSFGSGVAESSNYAG